MHTMRRDLLNSARVLAMAPQPPAPNPNLTMSYLEVHRLNSTDSFDPPKEFFVRNKNPFVPQDLRPLPGSRPSQLADYYACVAKMDETVGTLRKTLVETGLDKNTIVMFTSDRSCRLKTRNPEYKRTRHESSINIPLVLEGPGFNTRHTVNELVSQVDFAPTLLQAVGVTAKIEPAQFPYC